MGPTVLTPDGSQGDIIVSDRPDERLTAEPHSIGDVGTISTWHCRERPIPCQELPVIQPG